MIAQQVARYYAKALMLLAETTEQMDQFLKELKQFIQLQTNVPQLKSIFYSPIILKEDKKKLLKKIGNEKTHPVLLRFLLLLLEKNRFKYLPEVTTEYQRIIRKKSGVASVRVITTIPLDAKNKQHLVGKLEKSTGKKVEIEESVDPSLKGGGIIVYGNHVLDNSVRGKLEKLKRHFNAHKF